MFSCFGSGFGLVPATRLRLVTLGLLASTAFIAGCSSFGSSGPTAGSIKAAGHQSAAGAQVQVIPLTDLVARRIVAANRSRSFSEVIGDARPVGMIIGPGDTLQISIWEAPPALLYSSSMNDSRTTAVTGGVSNLPEQMVDRMGKLSIPFAGQIQAAGLNTHQIETEIQRRLDGKAHEPQVVVRLAKNATANVTVMGDVTNSARVPLTPKGERVLDILAAVGGSRQPITKTTIQITRGTKVVAMPLERVAEDPAQNILMQADDVVNVMYQPFSFTALGAVGNNAEIPFESTGITLSQALGRIGGLRDERADARGVFVFRLEDPSALPAEFADSSRQTIDGKVPVIYSLDLRNPAGFFIAQGFPVLNHDVVYVSNAPGADLQKFVNIVSNMAFSIVGIKNSL